VARTHANHKSDKKEDDEDEFSVKRFTMKDRCVVWANVFLFSRFYFALFTIMLIGNIFIIVWTVKDIKNYPNEWWFILLEIIITAIIIAEVTIRLMAFGTRKYFRSIANAFDFIVACLCAISLFLLLVLGPSFVEDLDTLISTSFLILRNVLQFLRLLFIIRHQRENLKQMQSKIDFSGLENPEPFDPLEEDLDADNAPDTHEEKNIGYYQNAPAHPDLKVIATHHQSNQFHAVS